MGRAYLEVVMLDLDGRARCCLIGWALVLWASVGPATAQPVTFDVYPPGAKVYREGGSETGLIPLGEAGRPIDLSGDYDKNAMILVITAPGRTRWRKSVLKGQLEGSTQRVYLAPENPVAYLADFPRYLPRTFAAACALAIALLLLAARSASRWLQRKGSIREEQRRREVLQSVGFEYERPFGKWLIVGKIGSGGMGEVLKAFPQDDVRSESMVAIKMRTGLDLSQASVELLEHDAHDRARFQTETKVLCGMDHPGIVKVHDWGELDGKDYFVMDLVQGENLELYLQRCPRPSYSEVRSIFCQLLDVIIFAHDKRVLHRDLKPLNILRRHDGRIVVIDFGLARDQSRTVALTQFGMPLAGTFEYMDPRASLQALARLEPTPSDPATDQFSLGAILFLMLTGRPALQLTPEADLLTILSQISEPRPSPREFREDIPQALEEVVTTMLEVDVSRRFPSLRQAKQAFEEAIAPLVDQEGRAGTPLSVGGQS
jgi:hypothetical protein